MLTPEILQKLRAKFPAAAHRDRVIKGGKRWFYIPWQLIRERIEETVGAENWRVEYPAVWEVQGQPVVRCRLTIFNAVREGLGFSKQSDKWEGDPTETATADAFKNAAEQFGIAAYLDDQIAVIRHLQSQGDGRGVQYGMRDKNGERSSQYNWNSGKRG